MLRLILRSVFTLVTSSTFCFSVSAKTSEKSFTNIQRLSIRNISGKIYLKAENRKQTLVKLTRHPFGVENCSLDNKQTGSSLEYTVSNKAKKKPTAECLTDFEIKVPTKPISIDIHNKKGLVKIEAVRGNIKFLVGSGQVEIMGGSSGAISGQTTSAPVKIENLKTGAELRTTSGSIHVRYPDKLQSPRSPSQEKELRLSSSSGSIQVLGGVHSAELSSSTGQVAIHFQDLPASASVNIKTNSGNAQVVLPGSTRILSDFRSMGRIYNELGDHEDAPVRIRFRSSSGGLKILAAK